MAPPNLLEAHGLASRWQIPVRYVRKLAREGRIPLAPLPPEHIRDHRIRYLFDLDEIRRWEEKGGTR